LRRGALRAARENRPDLIILDVLMPDMSGLEVCRRIKADPETADIPVLLVTALSDRASKMAGLEAGADDFLTKPVDEVTLLARVRSLIRARDTVRELRERGEYGAGHGFAESMAGFEARSRPGRIWLVAPGEAGCDFLEDRPRRQGGRRGARRAARNRADRNRDR
jgi:two-component system cell cycle response regulator